MSQHVMVREEMEAPQQLCGGQRVRLKLQVQAGEKADADSNACAVGFSEVRIPATQFIDDHIQMINLACRDVAALALSLRHWSCATDQFASHSEIAVTSIKQLLFSSLFPTPIAVHRFIGCTAQHKIRGHALPSPASSGILCLLVSGVRVGRESFSPPGLSSLDGGNLLRDSNLNWEFSVSIKSPFR